MLCTLSMLSNAKLALVARLVPVETIIFDEASQIEVGNYFPPIHLFHTVLKKMVFIGDDKQRELQRCSSTVFFRIFIDS